MVCVSIYLYGLPKQEAAKLPRHSTDDAEVKQKLITVWGGGALERPSMDWYFLVLYWAQQHSGKKSRTTDGRVLLRWHCFVVTCKYTGLMPNPTDVDVEGPYVERLAGTQPLHDKACWIMAFILPDCYRMPNHNGLHVGSYFYCTFCLHWCCDFLMFCHVRFPFLF